MPSLADIFGSLFPGDAPPLNRRRGPGLFQSRITHTPGKVGDVDAGTRGAYDPDVDPQKMALAATDLTPAERAGLAKQWAPLGKGFMTVPEETATSRPDVMRHEQLHALQDKAGLKQYADQIAAKVHPGVVDEIKQSPVYQEEAKRFGMVPTIADEGSAIELVNFGWDSKSLKDVISSKLDPEQKRQFSQIVGTQ